MFRVNKIIVIFTVATLIASCKNENEIAISPTDTNGSICYKPARRDDPCRLNIYSIVANIQKADGTYFETTVYYDSSHPNVFFINKETAEIRDRSSAFIFDEYPTESPTLSTGYWRVWGRFDFDKNDYGTGFQTYRQAGKITDIVRILGVKRISSSTTQTPDSPITD